MQTLSRKNLLLWTTRALFFFLPWCPYAQVEQLINHPTCPGKNTGRVELRIAKEVYPKLTFTLTDSKGIVQVKENVSVRSLEFNNLNAGPYSIKVDIPGVSGCHLKDYSGAIPVQGLELQITELIKPTTTSSTDGKITVMGAGGSGNYRFNLENGASSTTRSNLRAGDYTVTLTDINTGCERVETIRLEAECSAFKVTIQKNNEDLSLFISNLVAGKTYKIKITFYPNVVQGEPCIVDMNFSVPTLSVSKTTARFNENTKLCEYTEVCNGQQVGGPFNLKEVPRFDVDNLDGCKIKEVICGNQTFTLKNKISGVENMRIGEAKMFWSNFRMEHKHHFMP